MSDKANALRALREHCGPEVCPMLRQRWDDPSVRNVPIGDLVFMTDEQANDIRARTEALRTFSWAMAVIAVHAPYRCPLCAGERSPRFQTLALPQDHNHTERCLVGRVLATMEGA
jgi:hypothetical protein